MPKERTWRFRVSLDGNRDSRAYVWWDWHKTNGERCGVKVVMLPHPAEFVPMSDWQSHRTSKPLRSHEAPLTIASR